MRACLEMFEASGDIAQRDDGEGLNGKDAFQLAHLLETRESYAQYPAVVATVTLRNASITTYFTEDIVVCAGVQIGTQGHLHSRQGRPSSLVRHLHLTSSFSTLKTFVLRS